MLASLRSGKKALRVGRQAPNIAIPVPTASEALMLVDLVNSTAMAVRYGWHIGKQLRTGLQHGMNQAISRYPPSCQKFTGDGYLVAFHDQDRPDAVVHAFWAMVTIAHAVQERNQPLAECHWIKLRFALHFGEVEVVADDDREGLEVSYAFRLESAGKEAVHHITPPGPTHDYAILSDQVVAILTEHQVIYPWVRCPGVRLKGFRGE